MVWADVIAAILKAVGPLIGDVLAKWLEGLLKKTAAKAAPPSGAFSDASKVAMLLDGAMQATPRRQVMRRALLRKLDAHVNEIAGIDPWAKADRAEIKGLAAKAADE